MMRTHGFLGAACALAILSAGDAAAWSLLDEVTVLEPGLSAQLVWEDSDVQGYCAGPPSDLDQLVCIPIEPNPLAGGVVRFWLGLDGNGDAYGLMTRDDVTGTYFDILRRPAGTRGTEHLVRITEREELVAGEVVKLTATGRWQVDVVHGEILLNLRGTCGTAACVTEPDVKEHMALIKITGLPPLLDVVLSYNSSSMMSFRVPVHPEGLASGDFFDVYAGDVSTLPGLASAQPIACDVATGTTPGDVVSVPDTLPDPASGASRYYVVAVTHGLERRAGRQLIAGVLSGRDASVLPACP